MHLQAFLKMLELVVISGKNMQCQWRRYDLFSRYNLMIRTNGNKVNPLLFFALLFFYCLLPQLCYCNVLLGKIQEKQHNDQIYALPYEKPKVLIEKSSSKTERFLAFPVLHQELKGHSIKNKKTMENLISVIVELTIYLLPFNGFKSFAFFGLPLLAIKPIGLKRVEVVKRTKILLNLVSAAEKDQDAMLIISN